MAEQEYAPTSEDALRELRTCATGFGFRMSTEDFDRAIELVRADAVLALEPEAREITDAEVAAAYSAFVQASFGFPGVPAMRAALEAARDA